MDVESEIYCQSKHNCRRLAAVFWLLSFVPIGANHTLAQSPTDLERKLEALEARIDELVSADSSSPIDCTAAIRADNSENLEDVASIEDAIEDEQASCYNYIEKMMVGQSDCVTTPEQGRYCLSAYALPEERQLAAKEYKRQKEAHLDTWLSYGEAFTTSLRCEIASFCFNSPEAHSEFRDKNVEAYTEFPSYQAWLSARAHEYRRQSRKLSRDQRSLCIQLSGDKPSRS